MLETLIRWALVIAGAYLVVRVGLKLYRRWRGTDALTADADGNRLTATGGEGGILPLANGEPMNAAFVSPPGGGSRYGGYAEAGGVYTGNQPGGYSRNAYDADRRQYFLRRV